MRRIRQIFSDRSVIFRAPAIVLTFVGGLFFIAAWPLDKELIVPASLMLRALYRRSAGAECLRAAVCFVTAWLAWPEGSGR
jgi:hypothetical protein